MRKMVVSLELQEVVSRWLSTVAELSREKEVDQSLSILTKERNHLTVHKLNNIDQRKEGERSSLLTRGKVDLAHQADAFQRSSRTSNQPSSIELRMTSKDTREIPFRIANTRMSHSK